MPSRADLRIYQGDDFGAVVTVNNGVPVDIITGYTAKAQIREDMADACAVVAAEITADVASPVINLSLPRDVTANLCGQYVWDLELTDPGGTVSTILAGNVIVSSEVTREP
jgi:hypothetical protein